MVRIPDLSAVFFRRRLGSVRQAFEAAQAALILLADQHRSELEEYERQVQEGMEPIEEYDEDGWLLWSHDKLLKLRIDDATEALQSMYKATVISAYHVWEDASRRATGAPENANHGDLVAALKGSATPIHNGLPWVSHLVNTLKHGGAGRGRKLRSQKPGLFRPLLKPGADPIDWYDAIFLSPDVVVEVFMILSQSGPITGVRSHTGRL